MVPARTKLNYCHASRVHMSDPPYDNRNEDPRSRAETPPSYISLLPPRCIKLPNYHLLARMCPSYGNGLLARAAYCDEEANAIPPGGGICEMQSLPRTIAGMVTASGRTKKGTQFLNGAGAEVARIVVNLRVILRPASHAA